MNVLVKALYRDDRFSMVIPLRKSSAGSSVARYRAVPVMTNKVWLSPGGPYKQMNSQTRTPFTQNSSCPLRHQEGGFHYSGSNQ